MKTKVTIIRLTFSLLMLSAMSVNSAEIQSLASLRLQAEAFILQFPYQSPYKPGFKIGNLDSRLRLKQCPESLQIDFSNPERNYGNTALVIRCAQAPGWKIYLPVRVDLFDDVIVSAKPLAKGQIIDDSGFAFKKTNVSRLKSGYYAKNTGVSGLQVRRNLAQGTVLTPANLEPRLLVRSGQTVTLILNYKGIQIKSTGKALQSARLGQLVKVRNSQSQKIVEGIVSGDSQVQVSI